MDKKEAIENLYLTFRKYTTSNMDYCKCGCNDPEDVKKLASKKLRDLEEDDFSAYHGSALYTWGDVEHYKHFLPRILEVHNILNGRGLIGLFEITTKLDYAKWTTWAEDEVEAIKNFILVDWIEFVNDNYAEIGTDDLEYYIFFFGLQDLLSLWRLSQSSNGLRNFVYFFYKHGTVILGKGLKINDKIYASEWRKLLNSESILQLLEKEFFKVSESDSEYSEKISIVIQMLEQEQTVGNNKYT